jgi:hypothetical protein
MAKEYNLAPLIHCGIELEVERLDLTPQERHIINMLGFEVTSDASVECNRPGFADMLVVTTNPSFGGLDVRNVGCEIVSKPFSTESHSYIESIVDLCKALRRESFVLPSLRSSLHVHCSYPRDYNTNNLQNILRWGRALEGAIFRISSFLGEHRGEDNDYNYCRPITRKGPQVVLSPVGYVQIFDINDVLSVDPDSPAEYFWQKFGDCIVHHDNKYHPIRYSWLNIFSIIAHGTIEIRAFNQTLNAIDILAAIGLTQAFTNACINIPFLETGLPEEDSIFEPSGSEQVLEYILGRYGVLSDEVVHRIMYLFDYGHNPMIKDKYVLSHMNDKRPMNYYKGVYNPPVLADVEFIKPAYKDRHNIVIEDMPDYDLLRKGANSRSCAN